MDTQEALKKLEIAYSTFKKKNEEALTICKENDVDSLLALCSLSVALEAYTKTVLHQYSDTIKKVDQGEEYINQCKDIIEVLARFRKVTLSMSLKFG